MRALGTQRVPHEDERRRRRQDEASSSRVVEAQPVRSAAAAAAVAPAPLEAPRRPKRVASTHALIPLEVWDFAAWLRSRGLEGFDVRPEFEEAGTAA